MRRFEDPAAAARRKDGGRPPTVCRTCAGSGRVWRQVQVWIDAPNPLGLLIGEGSFVDPYPGAWGYQSMREPCPLCVGSGQEGLEVQPKPEAKAPVLTLASFLEPSKPAVKKKKFSPKLGAAAQVKYEDAVAEAVRDKLINTKDWWATRGPDHVVALYLKLHSHVYGADDTEARGEWKVAATAAKRFAAEHFGQDYHALIVFMRWVFGKEKAKRDKTPTDFRITWRLVLAPKRALVDYKVFLAKVNGTE